MKTQRMIFSLALLISLIFIGCGEKSISSAPDKKVEIISPRDELVEWVREYYPFEGYYRFYNGIGSGTSATENVAADLSFADAQNQLAQQIEVEIASILKDTYTNTVDNIPLKTTFREIARTAYQKLRNVEIVKTQTLFNETKKEYEIYTVVVVNKSYLADFYASQIDFTLNEAQRSIEYSKQLLDMGNRKEAREILSESKNLIDSTHYYRALLVKVDAQNEVKRDQSERANELLKEIAMVLAGVKSGIFIDGEENFVTAGLQTILSENNIIVAENENDAAYILKIEAEECNQISDNKLYFSYACVKTILTNIAAGKNELTLNITGQKGGGLSAEKARDKAFGLVVADVWAKIKDKILENLQ